MTIFLIARGYPSTHAPQWGSFEKDQAEALAQAGHHVIILSVDSRFRFYWRPLGIQFTENNDIPTYNIFLCPGAVFSLIFGQRLNVHFKAWQLNKIYQRAVRRYGTPDVLYSHYLSNTQIAIILKQKYNIPLVTMEHWSEMGKTPIKPAIIPVAQDAYAHTDQLLTVSSALQKNIQSQLHIFSLVVHNMVGKEFTYIASTTPHPFTFITTGSLIHRKGFDLLPAAFLQVQDSLPADWQMLVIGDGEEHANLQYLINDSGLQNHIRLLGQKTKTEIASLLQNSEVFILPSRGETFGVAIIEALACGLPVVATRCGGPDDIITPDNGVLVPVDDIDALATAIRTMYTTRTQYSHEAIADDCQARFSPQIIARQLTDIFKGVLDYAPLTK